VERKWQVDKCGREHGWAIIVLEDNPYQPPETRAALDGRRTLLKGEVLAATIAIACSMLLGGAGSLALRAMVFPSGEVHTMSPTLLFFLISGVKLAGRMPGDLLCGFVLGAYVRRPQVWWVLSGIAGFMITAMLFTLSLRHLGVVGSPGIVPLPAVLARGLAHVGMVCAYVALGIVLGTRVVGLRGTNTRRDARTDRPKPK